MPAQRRRKHVPQRTCVACRETIDKRSLIRIVRAPEGTKVDPTGKAPGRGAYVHDRQECWQSALLGPLERALKTSLPDDERETLRQSLEDHTNRSRA